jgi:hypothetical protein
MVNRRQTRAPIANSGGLSETGVATFAVVLKHYAWTGKAPRKKQLKTRIGVPHFIP